MAVLVSRHNSLFESLSHTEKLKQGDRSKVGGCGHFSFFRNETFPLLHRQPPPRLKHVPVLAFQLQTALPQPQSTKHLKTSTKITQTSHFRERLKRGADGPSREARPC